MEIIGSAVFLLAMVLSIWIINGGIDRVFSERRKTAEANARAEEAKLKRAKIQYD